MTTDYHTPIVVGAPANASTFNVPLASLDSAISNIVEIATAAAIAAVTNHSAVTLITFDDILMVGENKIRVVNLSGRERTISKIYLIVETAPAGADLIVDVHKNGTTLFTNQTHRPRIVAGATTGYSIDLDVSSWGTETYLTASIDQVGSGTAGSYLTVHIVYQEV